MVVVRPAEGPAPPPRRWSKILDCYARDGPMVSSIGQNVLTVINALNEESAHMTVLIVLRALLGLNQLTVQILGRYRNRSSE